MRCLTGWIRTRVLVGAESSLRQQILSQSELGDALGLSTVHVKRTLRELRAQRLITEQSRRLTILDWEGQTGEFDPIYLHQEPRR